MWRIPLPPAAARQSSKGNGNKAKGKASSKGTLYGCQEPYRAPAPAFPLGGAVPALADVGVNPAAPALAAPHASTTAAAAAAAAATATPTAAAAAAAAAAATLAAAAATGAASTGEGEVEQAVLQVTPVKPLAPQIQPSTSSLVADGVHQATSADGAAGGAAGAAGAAGLMHQLQAAGVMTRRQLRWAQQGGAHSAALSAPAGPIVKKQPTAAHAGPKARFVDL